MSSPTQQKTIPVAGPWINDDDIAAVVDAVTHGWYDNATTYIRQFEEDFATHTQRQYALSTPSCTSAIHLILAAIGVGPGDEVIVPELTWIASASPVTYVGAAPVFVDVDPNHWCMATDAFEAAITPRTKAAIVVDLYGNMPDWSALQTIADRHGVVLIEDAAQSIGASYNNRPAGSLGTAGVFSFHGAKTMTTGEGGMLVLDDPELYERCVVLRDHGRIPGDPRLFWQDDIGFKYKMTNIQAALGVSQLKRLPEMIEKKRSLFSRYQKHLANIQGLTLSHQRPEVYHAHWMSSLVMAPSLGWEKIQLMEALADHGVTVRPLFYPLSELPAFQHYPTVNDAKKYNTVAYRLAPYGINLPSALILSDAEVDRTCQVLLDTLFS